MSQIKVKLQKKKEDQLLNVKILRVNFWNQN